MSSFRTSFSSITTPSVTIITSKVMTLQPCWLCRYLRFLIHNATDNGYKPSHHNCFMALFLGLPGEPVPEEKLLDFMAQGKINRGRHTNHPTGRHSIRTNQCPPPPCPQRTSKNVAVTVDMAQAAVCFWIKQHNLFDKIPIKTHLIQLLGAKSPRRE